MCGVLSLPTPLDITGYKFGDKSGIIFSRPSVVNLFNVNEVHVGFPELTVNTCPCVPIPKKAVKFALL